ncbi:GNAT family N-acetyltransferase [Candidatus Nitrosopelagicus sp.]|nr:GNAT family N-acetyltransferase [Candidatus Nitrosopelagicus sp.]
MKIVDIDKNIIEKLRKSNISTKMKSLESCDWLVLEEKGDIIKAAAGMGGIFHVSGIQIHENFRGKGIGKIIQKELIDESERKGYSFITVFNDPSNTTSVKLHDGLGYEKIFRIHYAKGVVNDVKGISFNKKGRLIIKLLSFFNTKIGMVFLAISLEFLKTIIPKLIIYNEENGPSPNMKWIIKKFEKI